MPSFHSLTHQHWHDIYTCLFAYCLTSSIRSSTSSLLLFPWLNEREICNLKSKENQWSKFPTSWHCFYDWQNKDNSTFRLFIQQISLVLHICSSCQILQLLLLKLTLSFLLSFHQLLFTGYLLGNRCNLFYYFHLIIPMWRLPHCQKPH